MIEDYTQRAFNYILSSSQRAAAMSGGSSEVKFKEEIPMAECVAYGTQQTSADYSVSHTFLGGVIKGQQGTEGENEDACWRIHTYLDCTYKVM